MISCKMITYGRVELLMEALHSFLIQSDEDSELVIVNDYPLQKLIFDHPRVKIYNIDRVFQTIGDKENYAIERCNGDIIAVWDDDDIGMPWHLKNIKKYWKKDTNLLLWANGVYYNHPQITKIGWIGNSGIVYSRKAWEIIGKSPIQNAGGDITLVKNLTELGHSCVVNAHPPDEEVSWWYRWGQAVPTYHQSGGGVDDGTKPNVIKRNMAFVEGQRRVGLIPTGEIVLKPHWKMDYEKMLKKYVSRIHNTHIQ